jgi:parallel beta-helix repeat protein
VGVHAGQHSPINITNNVFTGNLTGVTFGWANEPTIRNNIIVNNDTGIHWYDDGSGTPQADIDYNDVWNNDFWDYNPSIQPGPNDIAADPLFTDASAGDYHLSPCSPAIDTGDPAFDYSNEPEPNGNRVNMGAYGNTSEATSYDCP